MEDAKRMESDSFQWHAVPGLEAMSRLGTHEVPNTS